MEPAGGDNEFGARTPVSRFETPASVPALLGLLPCRWCLLRDADFDAGSTPVEYDVLVDADRYTMRRTLTRYGAVRVRSWGRSPHRQFDWWDESTARVVRLDVVDELGYGATRELRIPARDHVLTHAVERDGWTRPSPSNEQWMALLHALLDRERFRPRDVARLSPWIAVDDDAIVITLPAALRRDLGGFAAAGDWRGIEARRGDVRGALTDLQRVRAAGRRFWRSAMRRTTRLQRAILRPGLRIALIGPDGSGKSTTISAMTRSGIVGSSVYLGVAPAGSRATGRVPGVALARTIRRLAAAWCIAAVRRRRGSSVALDRHPLEATIGPPTVKRTTAVRRRILANLLPRPEVVVVLMAPADVLHHRKPEHDLHEVEARRDRYVDLAVRHGYPIIETNRPTEEVLTDLRRVMHAAGRREGRR